MRTFTNIAKLIKNKRLNHPNHYSQAELSHLLGYKNGQFISNVERALCNIPLKMLGKISEILDINREELKDVIMRDHEQTVTLYLSGEAQILDQEKTRPKTWSPSEEDRHRNVILDKQRPLSINPNLNNDEQKPVNPWDRREEEYRRDQEKLNNKNKFSPFKK